MRITVAITGASGTVYAQRLLKRLVASDAVEELFVVLTKTAKEVGDYELGKEWKVDFETCKKVRVVDNDDFFTPIASGSNCADVMVVIPCSMGMVARIANGISNDLVARSADVMLKEGRKLIVVPRETPLSMIHLKNLIALKDAGGVVLPACPSFYAKPQSLEELIDSVVNRVLSQCKIQNSEYLWAQKIL